MNLPQKAAPLMRIIALPLARVKTPRDPKLKPYLGLNTNTMLVFYHFDLVSPACIGREDPSLHKKVLKRVMNKAVDIWTNLGKAPKGSWKLWAYKLGERISDRIEFEELALRNVDPSLGPAVVPLIATNNLRINDTRKNTNQPCSFQRIPLIYPPSVYSMGGPNHTLHPPTVHLKTLLAIREPQHRTGFYLWMFIAPLTAPITLIPIIPNFPLFFCVWRSWSHYRAYRSSQYLSSLLEHGLIEPTPSLELDQLYASSVSTSKISADLPDNPRKPSLPGRGLSPPHSTAEAIAIVPSRTIFMNWRKECLALERRLTWRG